MFNRIKDKFKFKLVKVFVLEIDKKLVVEEKLFFV